jgi:hypothetical protein
MIELKREKLGNFEEFLHYTPVLTLTLHYHDL